MRNKRLFQKEKSKHPCQKCGACCNFFRVTFPESETSPKSHGVPSRLTMKLPAKQRGMLASAKDAFRCVALSGKLGKSVSCTIYKNRPSSCRNFKASYELGVPEKKCDSVRIAHGLKALTPDDWL